MKRIFFLLSILLLISCSNPEESVGPLHGKKVLILGNSITQDGRYVGFIEYYLRKKYPNNHLDIISIGLSSETVSGLSEPDHGFPRPCLHDRLDGALELIKPDLVLACYGMNDGIYYPFDEKRFNAYKEGILKLKNKVETFGAKLILLTPTIFDADQYKDRYRMEGAEVYGYKNPYYKYNQVLDVYSDWLLTLRSDETLVIDLHSYLNSVLAEIKKDKPDSTFVPDGIHPNAIGHLLMAKKVLIDLYPEITVGSPHSEFEMIYSDPLYRLVEERRKIQSNGWLEYIGYEKGVAVKSNDIRRTKKLVKSFDLKIKALQ